MIDIILSAFENLKIENYIINDTQTESVELFFIKKSLDMRRCKDVHKYSVTVYHDFEKDGNKKRGSSVAIIHPGMMQEEVINVISDAYYAASFVSNPFFKLADASKEPRIIISSTLQDYSLEESALKLSKALFSVDNCENALINSSEIFVTKTTETILSSEGTNVSYTKYKANGEFIVQCTKPQDVEIYESFSYDNLDTDALAATAREALDTVKARSLATSAPATGEYTVILSGKELKEALSFYIYRSAANMIYSNYSKYTIGTHVQGDNIKGEAINITFKATIPYSEEGIKMIDRQLLENGELKLIHGNNRFCRYLDIEPTGNYGCIRVDNGTISFEEMKKDKCLHVVSFSAFDMDPFSGHFGGEIRLAYLYEGDKTTVLTGGSINGSFLETQNNLVFSTDRYKDSNYDGPYAIRFQNVKVAGI